jgi:hypothetical protein
MPRYERREKQLKFSIQHSFMMSVVALLLFLISSIEAVTISPQQYSALRSLLNGVGT